MVLINAILPAVKSVHAGVEPGPELAQLMRPKINSDVIASDHVGVRSVVPDSSTPPLWSRTITMAPIGAPLSTKQLSAQELTVRPITSDQHQSLTKALNEFEKFMGPQDVLRALSEASTTSRVLLTVSQDLHKNEEWEGASAISFYREDNDPSSDLVVMLDSALLEEPRRKALFSALYEQLLHAQRAFDGREDSFSEQIHRAKKLDQFHGELGVSSLEELEVAFDIKNQIIRSDDYEQIREDFLSWLSPEVRAGLAEIRVDREVSEIARQFRLIEQLQNFDSMDPKVRQAFKVRQAAHSKAVMDGVRAAIKAGDVAAPDVEALIRRYSFSVEPIWVSFRKELLQTGNAR